MAQDILRATAQVADPMSKKKKKISGMAIILVIILAVILILLGERIIFDLNRVANPLVENVSSTSSAYNSYGSRYAMERSALSPAKIYYTQTDKDNYWLFKILIHSAFIVPLFLLTFLFYYLVFIKNPDSHYKVLVSGYISFAIWMIIRLVIEVGYFVVLKYQNAAVYIILVFLALIFSLLVVFIQKKLNKHNA